MMGKAIAALTALTLALAFGFIQPAEARVVNAYYYEVVEEPQEVSTIPAPKLFVAGAAFVVMLVAGAAAVGGSSMANEPSKFAGYKDTAIAQLEEMQKRHDQRKAELAAEKARADKAEAAERAARADAQAKDDIIAQAEDALGQAADAIQRSKQALARRPGPQPPAGGSGQTSGQQRGSGLAFGGPKN